MSPGVATRVRIEEGKTQVSKYTADAQEAGLPVYMGYQLDGVAELFPPNKYDKMAKLIQWNGHSTRELAFLTVEKPRNVYEPARTERIKRLFVPYSRLLANRH